MEARIEVTQADIDEGAQYDCESCPVALAANRVLKKKYGANVGNASLWIFAGRDRKFPDEPELTTALPTIAVNFIHCFDQLREKAVAPLTFTVDIPRKYIRKEYR